MPSAASTRPKSTLYVEAWADAGGRTYDLAAVGAPVADMDRLNELILDALATTVRAVARV
jgi:hypothetical protein